MTIKKNNMRILLSNDDGIHAPGLKTLEQIAYTLSDDVWVVAPSTEQSGAGHSLTLNRPLRAHHLSDQRFSIDGTPTDCVLMAIEELMKGKKPDLILSGVNIGANIGDDVTYSGTVAAAMEGTSFGIPSIALSQDIKAGHPVKWQTPLDHAPSIIEKLIHEGWPDDVLINLNFPDVISKSVMGVEVVRQGFRPPYKSVIKAKDPRGKDYYWLGPMPELFDLNDATDLTAMVQNKIAITPLHLDLTHVQTLNRLAKVF
jgi:5'-nucleotidase